MNDLLGQAAEPAPRRSRKAPSSAKADVARLIDRYHDLYVARFDVKPIIHGGKDGTILKRLVAAWGAGRVEELLVQFMGESDPWAVRKGWTIDAFGSVAARMQTDVHGVVDQRTSSNLDAVRRAMRRTGE